MIQFNPNLTSREKHILNLRKLKLTLEAIGKHYHISKERVRQIEKKARHKLDLKQGEKR